MNVNHTFRYLNMNLPDDIRRLKEAGDFEEAIRLMDARLASGELREAEQWCYTAHREMMLRTADQFPYTREEALGIIRKHIPEFTEEEFQDYVDRGLIRWIYVNRQPRIFDRFYTTLVKTDPSFAVRAGQMLDGSESSLKGSSGADRLDRCMKIMKEQGSMSNRIRIRASLKMKDEVFDPGMFVRAHLPIPAAAEQQSEIVIEKVFPQQAQIAPEDAGQRTICWEETMMENHEFFVEYSYVYQAIYHDTEHMAAAAEQPDFYTQEQVPHIVFTPYIRELAASLTEGVMDPLEKARRFYDYMTLNMKYTFMPDYFVVENIAEGCARNRTGDCGVFALLFLTLCRCVGIPARWQSGLVAEPDFCGAHDWVQFYIAPYGWLYADVSFGIGAVRSENEERRKFYFGNMDVYRMVANHEFQCDFSIPKEQWRGDPYDNQVGEMETDRHGLTYDEFIRTKEVLLCEECERK